MPVISNKLKKHEKKAAAEEEKRKKEEERRQQEEQAKKEQEEKEAKEREEQEKRQKKAEKKAKKRAKRDAAKKAKQELEKKANMRKEMALIRKSLPAKQVRDEANIERQGLQIQRTELKSGHHSKIYKAKQGDQDNLVCKVIIIEKTPMPYRQNLTQQSLLIQRYIGGGATEANKAAGNTDPKHPGLCRVIDLFSTDKKVYIFMEECDPQTVEHKLKKAGNVDENDVKNYIRQTAEVVKYLHSVGVAHLNIKGSSLVLDKDGKVKLVGLDHCSFYWDPDMEVVVPKKKLSKKEWDKHNHMPPEAFTADFDASKADVWSLGVLMVSLISRENPFKLKDETPLDEQWKTFAQTKTFSDEAKQFLDLIFTLDVEKRVDMMEVVEDPYLKSGGESPKPTAESAKAEAKPDAKSDAKPDANAEAKPEESAKSAQTTGEPNPDN